MSLLNILAKTKLQPCCSNHCRDWSETNGGKYPASNHSPNCEHFKQETYYEIKPKGESGPWCIVEERDVKDITSGSEEYDVVPVLLTKDQFEHLDEFKGW